MISWVKPALLIAAAASLSAGGWVARGWYEGSQQLELEKDRAAVVEQVRKDVAGIADRVEQKLAKLKANERVIDRGVIREIQRPIYQRVCFEPELVGLLNASLRGESGPGPARPAGEVPESANSAD